MAFYRTDANINNRYIVVECPNGYLPEEWRDIYNAHPNAFMPLCNGDIQNYLTSEIYINVPINSLQTSSNGSTPIQKIVQFNPSTYQLSIGFTGGTINKNISDTTGKVYGTNAYTAQSVTNNITYWMIIDTNITNSKMNGIATQNIQTDGFPIDDYITTKNPTKFDISALKEEFCIVEPVTK